MPHPAARNGLVALASVGLVWGQYRVRLAPESGMATAIFCLAALAAALIALRRGNPARQWVAPVAVRLSPAVTSGLVAGTIVLLAGTALLYFFWRQHFYVGWLMVLLGTTFSALALHRADGPPTGRIAWSQGEVAGLLMALGLGACLRFYQYDSFPGAYTTHAIEEQQTGLGATKILTEAAHPWEFALDYHLTALALSFTDAPTFNTIRLPFTLASWLTILPAHLLFRQLYSTPAALFGTLLFAFSSWNLLYSRCAHPIFLSNVVVVLVFALLVHYGRTRRLASLPWIGLLTASTLYSYAGYRGTLLFVLAFLAAQLGRVLWTARRQPGTQGAAAATRRELLALGVVLVWVVAVATPIAGQLGRHGLENYYLESAHRSLANQQYYTSDLGAFVEQRAERLREVARLFLHAGDGSLTFNRPGTPMVDPLTALFFVPGLLLALLRPQRAYAGFLLFVLAVLLAGGTVFVQNLDVRRLQGVTLLVAAFAAHFADHLVWPRTARRRWLAAGLAGLVLAGVFAWSFALYHVRMAGDPAVRRAFRDHYTALIHYGRENRPENIALLSIIHRFFDPGFHYRANYAWLIDPVLRGSDAGDLLDMLGPDGPAAQTLVFQEPMEPATAAAVVRQVYPGTVCRAYPEPDAPSVAVTACEVPAGAAPRAVPFALRGRYWIGARDDTPDLERSEPYLGYGLVPKACTEPAPSAFCTAEWTGVLDVPNDGTYAAHIEWIGRVAIVDARLAGQALGERPLAVRPGRHQVHISARLPRDWETGVRLVLLRDGIAQPARFFPSDEASEPWPR